MCGICGFYSRQFNMEQRIDLIHRMCRVIQYRGPDGSGIWTDENNELTMGHQRLAIIDLTENGAQPMVSHDGRYVVSYNGEIYNYIKIKDYLCENKKVCFKGNSDTEVLVEAISSYGLDWVLNNIKGIYAFAIYDKTERKLELIRDRMGEKPLYYGYIDGDFVFASELQCFYQHPSFSDLQYDLDSFSEYFKYGYISAPDTPFKGIFELLPGHKVTIQYPFDSRSAQTCYYDIEKIAITNNNCYKGNFEDAVNEFEKIMTDAINLMKVADVPLGAFLSGGIDSSLVVAILQKNCDKPIKTFSIGLEDEDLDEAKYSRITANYLKTEHTECYLAKKDIVHLIPNISAYFAEPFGDNSAVASYLVSRMTRNDVTVALSGDGGDELFGGYDIYNLLFDTWNTMKSQKITSDMSLQRYEKATTAADMRSLYYYYDKKLDEIIRIHNKKTAYINININSKLKLDCHSQWMLSDQKNYLVYDNLTKVDRTSMANSLEVRTPFLYQDVVEFAWSLPLDYKIKGNETKRISKELLYRYIPREFMDRPKKGFNIPTSKYIKQYSELFEWAETYIELFKKNDFVDEKIVDYFWKPYVEQNAWKPVIWYMLMFEGWIENFNKANKCVY